ncbi:MAG: phage baseplate assembly protein V [Aquiluna sp.]|jgi:phage baseplate assembly protein V
MDRVKGSQDQGQCNLYFGYVTAVDEATGRARVRVDDLDGVESYWLAILQGRVAADQHAYWLDEGDFVAILSDERLEAGVILGCLYSQANPPPITTRDKYHRSFSDGGLIEYDRSTGTLTLTATNQIVIDAANGVHITNSSESTINGKAIAVIGAVDNDTESNGPDSLVTSGQL